MNPWLVILIFCVNFTDNALSVLYTRRAAAGRVWWTAGLGSSIDLIAAVTIITYTQEIWYVVPMALGSFWGNYWSCRWDKAYRRKKYGRKKKAPRGETTLEHRTPPVAQSNIGGQDNGR